MLRRFLAKIKGENPPRDNNRDEKKRIIKEWTSKIGVSWSDIENLLFWKEPRISLGVFIIVTGFFWKFISYKLQRIGLVIIAAAVPFSFPETCTYISRYCSEKFQLKPKKENRNLGFDVNDVYDCITDCWVRYEHHYLYLLNLKHTSIAKFYLITISYITLLVIVITCLPLAGMLYLIGIIVYFYPILNYLEVFKLVANRMGRLAHPFITHWTHSQTRRRRDYKRPQKSGKRSKPRKSLSDIETEEFIPPCNKESETAWSEGVLERSDQHSSDDLDEFQLRGQFHRKAEGQSSDYDEDSFLPSYNYQIQDEMPSLSAFDSMMEPLDDEFHRGLDFRNITVNSTKDNTDYDLPNDYGDEDLTSEDIDSIPCEDDDKRNVPPSRDQRHHDSDDIDSGEFDVDQEFEFLDTTELYDVTDEEIMEQNIGGHSHSESVIPGVSNILGY